MTALFSGPPPAPVLPPPPPTISQGMVAAQQSDQLLKRKMGVGTSILTSNRGLSDLGTTKAANPIGTS